jgi:hypothetical protein
MGVCTGASSANASSVYGCPPSWRPARAGMRESGGAFRAPPAGDTSAVMSSPLPVLTLPTGKQAGPPWFIGALGPLSCNWVGGGMGPSVGPVRAFLARADGPA